MRNIALDYLKGILMILVIIGHVLMHSPLEIAAKKVIFFFHVPLFLGISGYLLRINYLEENRILHVLERYSRRILIPFLVAFAVITFLIHRQQILSGNIHLQDLFNWYAYPYYHLWYVPALFLAIIFTKIAVKYNFLFILMFIAAFSVTLIMHLHGNWIANSSIFLTLIGDKRFYYLYTYFLAGFSYRNFSHLFPLKSLMLWFFLLFPIFLFLSFFPQQPFFSITSIILTCLFVIFCLKLAEASPRLPRNILSAIGENTLPVYLWHIIPVYLSHMIADKVGKQYLFYILTVIFTGITIYVILHLPRTKLAREILGIK